MTTPTRTTTTTKAKPTTSTSTSNNNDKHKSKERNKKNIDSTTRTRSNKNRNSRQKEEENNFHKKVIPGGRTGTSPFVIVLVIAICILQLEQSMKSTTTYLPSEKTTKSNRREYPSKQYQSNLQYKKMNPLSRPKLFDDPDRPKHWIIQNGTNFNDPSSVTGDEKRKKREIKGISAWDQVQNSYKNHPNKIISNKQKNRQQSIHDDGRNISVLEKSTTMLDEHNNNFKLETYFGNIKVVVGQQGPAVKTSRLYGLAQRNIGSHRSQWDAIATKKCIVSDEEGNIDKNNKNNKNTTLSSLLDEYLPKIILMGVQKGGTTALYNYLNQHPLIQQSGKEIYYLDEDLDAIVKKYNGIPKQPGQFMYGTRMKNSVLKLQEFSINKKKRIKDNDDDDEYDNDTDMRNKKKISSNDKTQNKKKEGKKISMDCTPNYMFYSDRVPYRIACLIPNVKLLALLRNPIDRARSQYDMKISFAMKRASSSSSSSSSSPSSSSSSSSTSSSSIITNMHGFPLLTFDEYIQYDIDALYETGVLQDWNEVDFDEFFHSPACDEAWRTYINSGLNAPVGMGLYALQLKPYMELIKQQQQEKIDGDGGMTLLPILSEDLRFKTEETYFRILDFLELPRYPLRSYRQANVAIDKVVPTRQQSSSLSLLPNKFQQRQQSNNETYDTTTTATIDFIPNEAISDSTRILMQEIFEPYNRKLIEYFGKEWENVWS